MANKRFGVELVVTSKGVQAFDVAGNKIELMGKKAVLTKVQLAQLNKATHLSGVSMRAAGKGAAAAGKAMSMASGNALRLGASGLQAGVGMAALATGSGNAATNVAMLLTTTASGIPSVEGLKKAATGAASSIAGMASKAGLAAKGLAAVSAPASAVVVAIGAAGLAVAKMGFLLGDLIAVNADAEDAMGRLNEMTDRQREIFAQVAKATGKTAAQMRLLAPTFEDLLKLARDHPFSSVAKALDDIGDKSIKAKEAADKLTQSLKTQMTGAQIVAIGMHKYAKSVEEAADALIEQKGIMDQFSFADQALKMATAFNKVKEQTDSAAIATKHFGSDIQRLAEVAKEMGFVLPTAFNDVAKAVDAETKKVDMSAEALERRRNALIAARDAANAAAKGAGNHKDAIDDETEALKRFLESIKSAEDGVRAFSTAGIFNLNEMRNSALELTQQMEIMNAAMQSAFSIGTGITTTIDKSAPAIKAAIDQLENLASGRNLLATEARQVMQSLAAGDVGALKAIAQALDQEAAYFTKGRGSGFRGAGKRGSELFGLGQLVSSLINAIKEQTPGRQFGGPIAAGQTYRVHKDEEVIVPEANGFVVPAQKVGGRGFTVPQTRQPTTINVVLKLNNRILAQEQVRVQRDGMNPGR